MRKIAISSLVTVLFIALIATMVSANPVVNPISSQSVNEGNSFSIDITTTAPDSGSTTFTAAISPQPSAAFLATLSIAKIDNTHATLTGTPSSIDAGSYTLTVNANDSNSMNSRSFTLTVVDVPASSAQLSISGLGFGNADQTKSNPDAEDEEDQNVFVTDTFILQNNGATTATGILLSPSFTVGDASDYDLNFTNAPTSLAPGESRTVTARIRVPDSVDAVNDDLEEDAIAIGELRATAAGGVTSNAAAMGMQVENKLRIKDIKVCHEDDCESANDGDTIDDVKPGEHIRVEVEVENSYSDSDAEDIDIEDIEVRLETDDDDNLDLDRETEDLGDLGANDEDVIIIEFDVEDDADDGTAEFTIELEGEDEFQSKHGEFARIRLDINRERHEISVQDILLTPETISCVRAGQSTIVTVKATGKNIGKDNEDDVSMEVKVADLDIGQTIRDISIDEDDEETFTFNMNIPANVRSGAYEVLVSSFINRDEPSDRDSATLTVPDCMANVGFDDEQPVDRTNDREEDDSSSDDIVVTTQPTPTNPVLAPPSSVKRTVQRSSLGSLGNNLYVMVLLGVIIVLVLIGVGLIVAVARKKQQ